MTNLKINLISSEFSPLLLRQILLYYIGMIDLRP